MEKIDVTTKNGKKEVKIGKKDVKNGKKEITIKKQFIHLLFVMVVKKDQLLEIDTNVMVVKILIFVKLVMKQKLVHILTKNIHLH